MNITQTQKTPCYFHLNNETKKSLNQLAKYYKTTQTSLIEEGARMLIQSRLKQISLDMHNSQRVSSLIDQSF